jgi:uncharacterized protein YbjT (DUF2867 family)
MNLVVIGGTGLIGLRLVKTLCEHGQQAVAAAPNTGVNSITGQGLADALKDVSATSRRELSALARLFVHMRVVRRLRFKSCAGAGNVR